MVIGHEMYSFLDGFLGYHQNMIVSKYRYKITVISNRGAFVWVIMPFSLKNAPPTYQRAISMAFREYLSIFMKLFLDDFNVFSNQNTHQQKLHLRFDKCHEFSISLNPDKCMFLVYSMVIMGYIMSQEGKLPNLKKISTIVNMPQPKTPKDIQVSNGMVQFY